MPRHVELNQGWPDYCMLFLYSSNGSKLPPANLDPQMISLLTNVLSQSAQTASKSADRLDAQAMQRLSTGVRVNAAQDDAAGLAIGVRMTSTINAANELIKAWPMG